LIFANVRQRCWILDAGYWISEAVFPLFYPWHINIFESKKPANMSYKKLEIWQSARELTIAIHQMTLQLPKFEQFEEAQQIRRSSKSVRSCIVEGYGRRRYKADFIRFLVFTLSSNDETIDHLETLFETGSLKDEILYNQLHNKLTELGKKLNNFILAVERNHNEFQI
jgi:four helix bundle protein